MIKKISYLIYIILVVLLYVFISKQYDSENIMVVTELEAVNYDDVLYTPEELHSLTEEEKSLAYVGWDYSYNAEKFSRFRTSQITLKLTPGVTYGIFSKNLTYAAKVWVDGVLLGELGTVSDSEDGFVPYTDSLAVYFTAGEETEIVIQRANFNHARWNRFILNIGDQSEITGAIQKTYVKAAIIFAFFLALGLINLGMFTGLPEKKNYLWFALLCFCTMILDSSAVPKLIMQLLPNLNWEIAYRLEKWSLILFVIFMILFLQEYFKNILLRWLDYTEIAIGLAFGLLITFTPTIVFTGFYSYLEAAVLVIILFNFAFLMVRGFIKRKTLSKSQKSCIWAIVVFFICTICTVVGIVPGYINTIELGGILLELIMTITMAMEYRDVRQAYEQSMIQEIQLRKMNESMVENQKLQENFMAIVNHEMRTPLTVIAGYAELMADSIEGDSDEEKEMIHNLQLISSEAMRLGRIVKLSDEGARTSVLSGESEDVNIKTLLEAARDFGSPICEKRNTRIQIECPELLSISCIKDSLLQALYNLVINASKHTENGRILLVCRVVDDNVRFEVRDNGDGMDRDTREHAFERGYTKDGGHGLGLTLCKEVAEKHGGSIWIEENKPCGTAVIISLPLKKTH